MASSLESLLAGHPFLKEMTPAHLQLIQGCASMVRFSRDQIVFRECEEAHVGYLISEGRVALETFADSHGRVTIQSVGPGEVVGWSWLIPPHHWRFNARATEPAQAIALDGQSLRSKCETDHDLGYELLKRLSRITAERLEMTRLQLVALYETRARK
ncbi:MAG: cyclic nucleotide-binding domain-containing protein [Verrucomicrobia bacterium]|nr:cyclic nucleotide-binding domain-containing protein [Verrucomicrobiota bacterium]